MSQNIFNENVFRVWSLEDLSKKNLIENGMKIIWVEIITKYFEWKSWPFSGVNILKLFWDKIMNMYFECEVII